MEAKLKAMIGELMFQNAALQAQLEAALAKIKSLEANNEKPTKK